MWPRGNCLLMAVPNVDGSFACTCVLPVEGEQSFASLQTDGDIQTFFQDYFTDIVPLMPSLVQEFRRNPVGHFVTTSTSPWYFENSIVLVGDSCHSFVPFYGQGMNASFEDCMMLDHCLQEHAAQRKKALEQYQCERKRHTDAIAELSIQNFLEIRAKVRSPMFILQKKMDLLLNRLFPRSWVPLYTLIMHTTLPYADAIERVERQEYIRNYIQVFLALIVTTVSATWIIATLNHIKRL